MNTITKDVVAVHRQWNCAPRLPSKSQLDAIRAQQYPQARGTNPPPPPSQPVNPPAPVGHTTCPPSTLSQLSGTNPPLAPSQPVNPPAPVGRTTCPSFALSEPSGTNPPAAPHGHATHPPSTSLQLSGTVDSPAAPAGPATEGAEPWQIQFYKPAVQDILERAKQFSHCNAASVNAFPPRSHFNTQALEYVEEVISERISRGLPISDGTILIIISHIYH